jgi:hypothetical protein
MHDTPLLPQDRCQGDQGAVVVEFALIAPILVWLSLALFEGGMFFRQQEVMANSIQLAGRVDANSSNNRAADRNGILAVKASLNTVRNVRNDFVIIFDGSQSVNQNASGKMTPDPIKCIAKAKTYVNAVGSPLNTTSTPIGDSTSRCSIFTAYMIQQTQQTSLAAAPPASGGYGTANATSCVSGTDWDYFYCPATRKIALAAPSGPPDWVGMYYQGTYTTITGLFGRYRTFTDVTAFKVEPAAGSNT